MKTTYWEEIHFIIGNDFKKIPLVLIAFILASFVDVVGLGVIGSYISLITDSGSVESNYLYNFFSLDEKGVSEKQFFFSMGVLLLGVFFCKALLAIYVNWVIVSFSNIKGASIRAALMHSYQGLCYSDYLSRNSSEYIHSIQLLSAQFAQSTLPTLLRFFSEGVMVLAIFVFLAWTNATALAILTSLIVVFIFLYDRIFRYKLTRYGELTNEYQIKLVQGINESIRGFKEIRVLGKELFFHELISARSRSYAEAFSVFQLLSLAPRFFLEFILMLFLVIFVFVVISLENDFSTLVPTLSVFGVAALRLIPAANVFSTGLAQLRYGRKATAIIYNDLTLKNVQVNSELDLPVKEFRSLKLKNMDFSYEGGRENVLNDISFSIIAGESIGIIGETGSGKTTLINLILGLLTPVGGGVFINDVPLETNINILKANAAYLPQEIFLTDDTVRRNIALGVVESDIDDNKIGQVLKQASLDDFIEQLPNGVNTVVGENGMRVSGGQRQRIALARAFYHNRSLLVMDESTSALDNATECEIIEEIRRFKGKKTMIIIAHRLSTLQHCDRVFRLDKGRIVEQGSYETVIGNKANK